MPHLIIPTRRHCHNTPRIVTVSKPPFVCFGSPPLPPPLPSPLSECHALQQHTLCTWYCEPCGVVRCRCGRLYGVCALVVGVWCAECLIQCCLCLLLPLPSTTSTRSGHRLKRSFHRQVRIAGLLNLSPASQWGVGDFLVDSIESVVHTLSSRTHHFDLFVAPAVPTGAQEP